MTPEREAGIRALRRDVQRASDGAHGVAAMVLDEADAAIRDLLAALDATRSERSALHTALVALTADVEAHIAANECGTGALRVAVDKVPT